MIVTAGRRCPSTQHICSTNPGCHAGLSFPRNRWIPSTSRGAILRFAPLRRILGARAAHAKQRFRDKLIEHRHYVDEYGEDMPEIQNWQWRP